MKSEVFGKYKIQLVNSDNSIQEETEEQNNLILDSALNYEDYWSSYPYLAIGSGVVTPPSVTDTNLGNQVAVKLIRFTEYIPVIDEGSTYLATLRGTTEFTNIDGDISELGLRRDSATGPLFTRALIKDSAGNPTSIQISSGQKLKITYSIYVRVEKIISSGVTPTPHGDLYWDLVPDLSRIRLDKNFAMIPKANIDIFGFSRTGTFNKDIPNRNASFTATLAATTSDRTFNAGSDFTRSTYSAYVFKLTQPYTLPANYEMTVSFETSWGRRS
tara:strand:+ start:19477 stop:20295 length:819 start_codon:yes stop_codon:yes gene_type:complete